MDIELAIKIPEEQYVTLTAKSQKEVVAVLDRGLIINAVKNGTILPKGHGRLIDVNDLLDDINLEDNGYNRDVNVGEIITLENIDRIPTIIEADKAESEDKE